MAQGGFTLNCSLALADVPVLERPARARSLGYDAVEFWWPFDTQDPESGEVAEFVDTVTRAGVETVLFNFPGGGPSVGDRGLLCVPGRQTEFVHAARTAIDIGRRLGVQRFNPMVGNTDEWTPESEAFATAVENLVSIDSMVGDAGATVVLEPLSGFPQAALKTFAQARQLVLAAREAGAQNVAILFDLYHAAVNHDPVLTHDQLDLAALDIDLIGHVQIADAPGRGWPGTGALPLGSWIHSLRDAGYTGRIGLECTGEPVAAGVIEEQLLGPFAA